MMVPIASTVRKAAMDVELLSKRAALAGHTYQDGTLADAGRRLAFIAGQLLVIARILDTRESRPAERT